MHDFPMKFQDFFCAQNEALPQSVPFVVFLLGGGGGGGGGGLIQVPPGNTSTPANTSTPRVFRFKLIYIFNTSTPHFCVRFS